MAATDVIINQSIFPGFFINSPIWIIPSILIATLYQRYVQENFESHPPNRENLYKQYDFIIVGAGSAGCVVANRLSENPYDKVLLIEAGGDENEITDVPALAGYLQLTERDWQYRTEPQNTSCLAMVGRRCKWPRGKVLGGSSVLNYMVYVRGNKYDYNNWASSGNYGWSFEEVLPYFKKSEDNRNPTLSRNTKFHSTGGYLTVSEPPWRTPVADAVIEAAVESGYKNIDFNSRFQEGFMIAQGTIRNGSRCSTSKAFLRPVRHRKNLHIAKYTYALKVLINPKTKRTYGVRVYRKGKVFNIYARKEVILSAGSINSPQLLMLSGIGPNEHLESLNIPVIKDSSVGNNLQDHIAVGGIIFTLDSQIAYVTPRYSTIWAALRYANRGEGPLTIMGGLEVLAFVKTKFANQSIDYPDVEYQFSPGSRATDGGQQLRKIVGLTEKVWIKYLRPLAFKDSFAIFPKLMRPKSRGHIRLRSKNPFYKPLITSNYLTVDSDIEVLVEGTKQALKLMDTHALRRYGAKFYTVPIPGCEQYKVPSDDYFRCLARHYTTTIYHPVGTAKMGPYSDPEAVVDPELKVYGISGLRVIDGSIMPQITTGNTNAPIIMIGEKGSDMIKQFWKNRNTLKYNIK